MNTVREDSASLQKARFLKQGDRGLAVFFKAVRDLCPAFGKMGLLMKAQSGRFLCRLGVKLQAVTEKVAEEQHMPQGLFVTEILSDSPALAGGIRNGDILVRLDEKEIRTVQDLQDALAAANPDDRVDITVMRSSRREYTEQTLERVVQER